MQPSQRQLLRIHWNDALRGVRLWLFVAGIFALGLAATAVTNSVGNPETWPSAFSALAAAGALVAYAGWLAGFGALLLVLGAVLSVFLRKVGDEL